MKRYSIVVEKAENNYSAYVPDLPGCVTTGETAEEAMSNMHEAINLHLEAMRELGIPIPEPTAPPELLSADSHAYTIEVGD